MADYLVTDTELTSIANAIRTKGGTSANLSFPTEFVSAINDISTGGGTYTWMGNNPVKVKNLQSKKVYLEDSAYATWTPTTTTTTLESRVSLPDETVDASTKDVILWNKFHVHFEYDSSATGARIIDFYYVDGIGASSRPSNFAGITSDTPAILTATTSLGSIYGAFYKGTNDNDYFDLNRSYGLYIVSWNGYMTSTSNSTNLIISPCTPQIMARCNNNYFTTANASLVDQSTSYYELVSELWKVDRGTSAVGYIGNNIRDMWLNGI